MNILIAIDGNEANVAMRVGSNVFAFEMMCALEQITRTQSARVRFQILLQHDPMEDLPKPRKGWQYVVLPARRLWTQWTLPRYLSDHQQQIQVLYSPGHYAPVRCPVPYAITIMDLAYLTHPSHFTWKDRTKLTQLTAASVRHARHIFCISQATQSQVLDLYSVTKWRTSITYPALSDKVALTKILRSNLLHELQIDYPYFLYVGTLQPRKNVVSLVKAYERFAAFCHMKKHSKKDSLPHLVLAGKPGWLTQQLDQTLKSSSVQKTIHRLGYVTDQQKAVLFDQSVAAVCLSLEEGFGIPSLEALQYGTIPLVSNSSSLPEVVGPAGILVDPLDTEAIAEQLWSIYTMKRQHRAQLRKLGRVQVAKFSWQHSAQQVLKTMHKIART